MKIISTIIIVGLFCASNALAQAPSVFDSFKKGGEARQEQQRHDAEMRRQRQEQELREAKRLRQQRLEAETIKQQNLEKERIEAETLLLRIEACKSAYDDDPEEKKVCIDQLMRN